jgi:hypothetical protein
MEMCVKFTSPGAFEKVGIRKASPYEGMGWSETIQQPRKP